MAETDTRISAEEAANSQLYSQKLPYRLQVAVIVMVIVIVDAGFAGRFRDGDPASPDFVTRLRRIS